MLGSDVVVQTDTGKQCCRGDSHRSLDKLRCRLSLIPIGVLTVRAERLIPFSSITLVAAVIVLIRKVLRSCGQWRSVQLRLQPWFHTAYENVFAEVNVLLR